MRKLLAACALGAMILTAGTNAAAAAGTTPIAEVRRGTMVAVAGTVDRILDTDEFRLRDASGAIRIYVGPNWVPVDVGERVTVRGFVDNDLRKEVYAREIVRADGSIHRFNLRYD